MSEVKTLRFGITGEFVTKIAREWFFLEGKDYKVVEELLLSCMCGTDIPEGELKLMAQDILLGKAEFRGGSADDTFRYVTLDTPAKTNLFTEYSKARQEVERLKNALADTDKQYSNLLDALRSWWEGNAEEALEFVESKEVKELLLDLMALYDQVSIVYTPGYGKVAKFPDNEVVIQKTTGEPILDSFMAQQRIEAKHKDNYGWLEPDGTFHPVPWCDHQEFAAKTIEQRGWWDEFDRWDDDTSIYCNGDFLTMVKGWVLLHNPGRGVALVTRDESKRLTKAQKEFLFGYFADRNMPDKAKLYLEE